MCKSAVIVASPCCVIWGKFIPQLWWSQVAVCGWSQGPCAWNSSSYIFTWSMWLCEVFLHGLCGCVKYYDTAGVNFMFSFKVAKFSTHENVLGICACVSALQQPQKLVLPKATWNCSQTFTSTKKTMYVTMQLCQSIFHVCWPCRVSIRSNDVFGQPP